MPESTDEELIEVTHNIKKAESRAEHRGDIKSHPKPDIEPIVEGKHEVKVLIKKFEAPHVELKKEEEPEKESESEKTEEIKVTEEKEETE